MAKQKVEQKSAFEEALEAKIKADERALAREEKARQFGTKKAMLLAKKEEIRKRTIAEYNKAMQKYGDQTKALTSPTYAMMANLYKLCNQMDEAMSVIETMQNGLDYLVGTIEIVDNVIDQMNFGLDVSLEKKYGFFQRLATKIKMRRARRNQANRIKTLCEHMKNMMEMINLTTESVSGMMEDVSAAFNTEPKHKKKKAETQELKPTTAALDFMSELQKEGIDVSADNGKTDEAGGAPAADDLWK